MDEKKWFPFITLTEAAARAGYRSTATLRRAAKDGRLQAHQAGEEGVWFTTQEWLDAYIASRRPWGKERGHPNSEAHYKKKDEAGE